MSGSTQNVDGSKKPWKHGKAVASGEVRFTSVSALERADSSSETGCLRKWWYRYRGGIPDPPPSGMMERGDRCHAEVAQYLVTGQRSHLKDPLILSGFHQLPPPGPDLCIEYDIVPDLPDGKSGLALARLRVADIPVVGSIDLMHSRPENYGVQDPGSAIDEPGVLKITDHKFTSDVKWAKSASDLPDTLQMAGYATWAFEFFPDVERIRLTHNYFPVKGQPRAPTIIVDRDDVRKTWERARAIGVSIKDAAREANPDRVDSNTRACQSYGRECPAITVCRAARDGRGVSALIGVTAASRLLKPKNHLPVIGEANHVMSSTPATGTGNLMARLQAQASGQAPAPQNPLPQITSPVAPPQDVQAEIARLSAIEAAATGQAPPQPEPAPAPAPAQDPVLEVASTIAELGLGMPQIAGNAAQILIRAYGHDPSPRVGLAGSGVLAQFAASTLDELNTILAGARELIALHGSADKVYESACIPLPAQEAPSSVVDSEGTSSEKPKKERKKRESKKKKEDDAPAEPAAETSPPAQPAAPAAETTSPAVTPLAQPAAPAAETTSPLAAPATETLPPAVQVEHTRGPTPQPPGAINCYVDVVCEGLQATSLWPLVHMICENMHQDAAPNADSVTDFRLSDAERYKFKKWTGVIAACLRSAPSEGLMPPGNYVFNGSMEDIGSVVAETMRQICHATGGAFVKGAR